MEKNLQIYVVVQEHWYPLKIFFRTVPDFLLSFISFALCITFNIIRLIIIMYKWKEMRTKVKRCFCAMRRVSSHTQWLLSKWYKTHKSTIKNIAFVSTIHLRTIFIPCIYNYIYTLNCYTCCLHYYYWRC